MTSISMGFFSSLAGQFGQWETWMSSRRIPSSKRIHFLSRFLASASSSSRVVLGRPSKVPRFLRFLVLKSSDQQSEKKKKEKKTPKNPQSFHPSAQSNQSQLKRPTLPSGGLLSVICRCSSQIGPLILFRLIPTV